MSKLFGRLLLAVPLLAHAAQQPHYKVSGDARHLNQNTQLVLPTKWSREYLMSSKCPPNPTSTRTPNPTRSTPMDDENRPNPNEKTVRRSTIRENRDFLLCIVRALSKAASASSVAS